KPARTGLPGFRVPLFNIYFNSRHVYGLCAAHRRVRQPFASGDGICVARAGEKRDWGRETTGTWRMSGEPWGLSARADCSPREWQRLSAAEGVLWTTIRRDVRSSRVCSQPPPGRQTANRTQLARLCRYMRLRADSFLARLSDKDFEQGTIALQSPDNAI